MCQLNSNDMRHGEMFAQRKQLDSFIERTQFLIQCLTFFLPEGNQKTANVQLKFCPIFFSIVTFFMNRDLGLRINQAILAVPDNRTPWYGATPPLSFLTSARPLSILYIFFLPPRPRKRGNFALINEDVGIRLLFCLPGI